MATTLVTGMVLKVRFVYVLRSQVAYNVRHYRVSGVTGSPTDAGAAQLLGTQFAATLRTLMTPQATYKGLGVQIIKPLVYPEVFDTTSAGVGTATGDALPPATAGLISLRTALAGRANRGRFYIPFPAEADNDVTGVPTAGYTAACIPLNTKLLAAQTVAVGGSATLTPGVYHRTLGNTTDLVSGIIRTVWAQFRSRGDFSATGVSPI